MIAIITALGVLLVLFGKNWLTSKREYEHGYIMEDDDVIAKRNKDAWANYIKRWDDWRNWEKPKDVNEDDNKKDKNK